jgi:hypothetical protein
MQARQFIDIIQKPQAINSAQIAELELLVKEYPFFESAHLLYTKALHQHNAINYSKQLRKTAIVANSRTVLYELIHQKEVVQVKEIILPETTKIQETTKAEVIEQPIVEEPKQQSLSPVSVTNSDIKVIYVNTVSSTPKEEKEIKQTESSSELEIIKTIENETEAPGLESTEDKLNKEIELEITKGIVQSYVETDIIKTPQLEKEENKEPVSFTDWLNKVKKEAGTIQITTSTKQPEQKEEEKALEKEQKTEKKSVDYSQKRQIIDKIIESEPGRIKLGNTKFFTPNVDAKQSLLENEHLVTETLAKIYALQGNISKAIRAYEILSLKFPQKSVYFASLIEKLKTNK